MVMEDNKSPYRTPSPYENAHNEQIRRMSSLFSSSLFSSSFTANLLRDLNRPAHRDFPPCDLPIDVRRYADGPPQLSLFREEDNNIYDERRQSQNLVPTQQPVRYRDPNGRYSTETRSRLLNAEERAARYALMLKSERRRSKSFGTIIRLKDETISKMHSDIKALKEEVARLKIKTKCKTE